MDWVAKESWEDFQRKGREAAMMYKGSRQEIKRDFGEALSVTSVLLYNVPKFANKDLELF